MFCVQPSYCFVVGFVGYVLGCSFASCVFWYLVRPIGLVFGWFGFRRLGLLLLVCVFTSSDFAGFGCFSGVCW